MNVEPRINLDVSKWRCFATRFQCKFSEIAFLARAEVGDAYFEIIQTVEMKVEIKVES